jgi:glycerophosphoryl diester phosphodiesterase
VQEAAPENTLAAFDAALSAGLPHFEFDVQLSRDGAAVRRCYCMGSSQSLVK